MSDCKTVTHEGNVYELDKHYLFGISQQLHKLLKIDKLSDYPFRVMDKGDENGFKTMHLVDLDAGTITPAPIDLIDGNAYMFNVQGNEVIGLYSSDDETLTSARYCLHYSMMSNIRPMTVAESK
jgi:hypothetical protein